MLTIIFCLKWCWQNFLVIIGNFGDRYFGTDAPPDWSDEEMDEPSYWSSCCFMDYDYNSFFFHGVNQGWAFQRTMWGHILCVSLGVKCICSGALKKKLTTDKAYSQLVDMLNYIILPSVNAVVDGCIIKSEIFLYVQYVTTVSPNVLFECLNCDNLFLNLKAHCFEGYISPYA